jgi:hypothetical protein
MFANLQELLKRHRLLQDIIIQKVLRVHYSYKHCSDLV